MVCIYCGNPTQVTNSRLQRRTNSVWRRRACTACAQLFTSIEQADMVTSILIDRNGALEGFDRDTLLLSVYDALKHRETALKDAQGLTRTIIANALKTATDSVVARGSLIKEALQVLERFDTAAATMYRAYHK